MYKTDNIRFECCLDENNGIKYRVFRYMWSVLKRKGANLGKNRTGWRKIASFDWVSRGLHLLCALPYFSSALAKN